jgi:plastocyanin domain-containing protein
MLANPFHPLNHVLQAIVEASISLDLAAVKEAIRSDSIVDLNNYNVAKVGNVGAVEVGVGVRAEPSALDKIHDG